MSRLKAPILEFFTDNQYVAAGIEVSDRLDDCDVLFGVKEVPID
jgi:hypothetical protein